MFPCFDQPDLKATWSFSALTDEDWIVISNEAPIDNEERASSLKKVVDEARDLFNSDELTAFNNPKATVFDISFKISTYLYVFCAGKFGFFERKTEGMPLMRIYVRQSCLGDVNQEDMFTATQCGITFYEEFFGRKYPFRKYDQVFVPEHAAGAMENVGCVTYNEAYLFRGEAITIGKKVSFTITNTHELGHMWFGNLITMKWWNDLWLNESFATFMSVLIVSKSPGLKHFRDYCWLEFMRDKHWGISTD